MHISASVFINDDESGLHHDYEAWLELAPHEATSSYRHNRTGVFRSPNLSVITRHWSLSCRPWRSISLCDICRVDPVRLAVTYEINTA